MTESPEELAERLKTSWRDDFNEEEFAAWVREGLRGQEAAWTQGNSEAWLSSFSEAVLIEDRRALGAPSGSGHASIRDRWALREFLPEQRGELVATRAPHLVLSLIRYADHGGNEVELAYVSHIADGSITEVVSFDAERLDDAEAEFAQRSGQSNL